MSGRYQPLAGLRIGIYARYSSDKQNDTSATDQIDYCAQSVARLGGNVSASLVFRDEAISGASLDRPGWQACMAAVRTRRMDVLVVESQSRVSRSLADSASVLDELRFLGVTLLGVSDGLDTRREDSDLMAGVNGAVNQQYLRKLGRETKRGMTQRARAQKVTGGRTFGYKSVDAPDGNGKVWMVDEAEAAWVRRIFTLYATGTPPRTVAEMLDTAGVPPPRSKSEGWKKGTVSSILGNERYLGVVKFNQRHWMKRPGTNQRVPRPGNPDEQVRYQDDTLRIVSDEQWQAVAARRAAEHPAKKGRRGLRRKRTYPLSGLLVCGGCGAQLVIANERYYGCKARHQNRNHCSVSRTVREDHLRAALMSSLTKQLGTPRALRYLRDQLATRQAAAAQTEDATRRELTRTLAQADAAVTKLVDLAMNAGEGSGAIMDRLRQEEARRDHLRTELAALANPERAPAVLPQGTDPDAATDALLRTILHLPTLAESNPEAARDALRLLLGDTKLTVTHNEDGSTVVTGELYPLGMLLPPAPSSPNPGRAQQKTPSPFETRCSELEGISNDGCGGRI